MGRKVTSLGEGVTFMGDFMTSVGSSVTSVGEENKLIEHGLKKHAATIHCSNSLSLLQRKISNALLYHAYKELMLKEEHDITIKQLCKLIAYHGNNHAAIKDALKGLLATVIEWNLVSDVTGEEDWTASAILASVNLRGPLCKYAYSPRMKQLLHTPSMFGKINLFIQAQFKSSYGLALYENCIRYRGLPHTKWFEMDLFRKLMGVPLAKYPIFRDFKRRVLDKSVQEINTYSDIIVEAELFREARQVTKIRFILKERIKKNRLGATSNNSTEQAASPATEELMAKLVGIYGFTTITAGELLTNFTKEFIQAKMAVVEASKNFREGRVENLSSYLLSALKNDYQPAKSSLIVAAQQSQSQSQQRHQIAALKKLAEQIKKDYSAYRDELISNALKQLPRDDHVILMEKFYQSAAPTIEAILKVLRNHTRESILASPMIKESLHVFALQQLDGLSATIMTLAEFVETLPGERRQAWLEFLALEETVS
jgi:hypothetical protein